MTIRVTCPDGSKLTSAACARERLRILEYIERFYPAQPTKIPGQCRDCPIFEKMEDKNN